MYTHEIVILGANFAGVQTAHYLLTHTFPAIRKLTSKLAFHITIIAPNTHTYYKIGAPRTIAAPEKIDYSQIFLPIEEEFAKYSSKEITFLQGRATGITKPTRAVEIAQTDGTTRSIPYDSLVIATGSRFKSDIWNLTGSHTTTEAVLRNLHKQLQSARTVYIGGGGAAGVETSAEIAQSFPKAELTLLSGTTRVLPRLSESTSRRAEKKLRKLGITVLHNLKVIDSFLLSDGRTKLALNNNTACVVDVYIDATGGKPNTTFLPRSWTDIYGFVSVDECLRGNKVGMEGVYAIGDCASYSACTNMDIYYSVAPLASSIGVDLAPRRKKPRAPLRQKSFKTMKETLIVSIGDRGGVMQVMGWGMPSWVVWAVKSRTFMIGGARKTVSGGNF